MCSRPCIILNQQLLICGSILLRFGFMAKSSICLTVTSSLFYPNLWCSGCSPLLDCWSQACEKRRYEYIDLQVYYSFRPYNFRRHCTSTLHRLTDKQSDGRTNNITIVLLAPLLSHNASMRVKIIAQKPLYLENGREQSRVCAHAWGCVCMWYK